MDRLRPYHVAIAIILVIAIIVALRKTTPKGKFGKLLYGDLSKAAPTQLYYAPPWLGKLDKSPKLEDVIAECSKDANCSAFTFTSEEQAAQAKGLPPGSCSKTPDPPECLAVVEPYQLVTGADTIYYFPRSPASGPELYVKKKIKAIAKS